MIPVPYAHFYQRVLATLLDAFLTFALTTPFSYLLDVLVLPELDTASQLFVYDLFTFLLFSGLIVFSFAICLERFGGTPGKLLLGLKVLDQHTGEYLNRRQAGLRIIASWLSILTGIGVLLIIFDKHKQAAHDKIMHSIVIKLEDDYAEMELPKNWRSPS
jgi:uncharacterized RDD family membrane protein YckC